MRTHKPIRGYVQCGVTYTTGEWRFEVLNEQERIAIVDIETPDGTISIGLNRPDAEDVLQKLTLFLQDWPENQARS